VMQAVLSALAVNEKQTGCTDPMAACVRQLKGRREEGALLVRRGSRGRDPSSLISLG
jgi:hypothetical protein